MCLGDSGYPLRPWLQTPIRDAIPGSAENRYNDAFKKARSLIERCNGLLKMRFRCLFKHRVLHYSPTKSSLIINACAVLHNICIIHRVPEPQEGEDEQYDFGVFEDELYDPAPLGVRNPDLVAGERLQNTIVNNYFR